jgi:RNA polymerase-binding transcription factor DksA
MTPINTKYEQALREELALLEAELKSVGRINPENPDDWEPVAGETNIDPAEAEERAGEITDFEDRSAVEFTLEEKYNKVKAALGRIAGGTYGVCKVCGNAIEEARLSANPSADTCIAHKEA